MNVYFCVCHAVCVVCMHCICVCGVYVVKLLYFVVCVKYVHWVCALCCVYLAVYAGYVYCVYFGVCVYGCCAVYVLYWCVL